MDSDGLRDKAYRDRRKTEDMATGVGEDGRLYARGCFGVGCDTIKRL